MSKGGGEYQGVDEIDTIESKVGYSGGEDMLDGGREGFTKGDVGSKGGDECERVRMVVVHGYLGDEGRKGLSADVVGDEYPLRLV